MGGARPDDRTLYLLYVEEELTAAQIAERFGVAPSTMHNWLVKARVPMRPSPARPRAGVTDDTIVRLYTQKRLTGPQIAAKLGCGVQTVYHRLRRLGIERRQPQPAPCPDISTLTHLYLNESFSLRAVAARYEVSVPTVQRWLAEAKIPSRERPEILTPDDAATLYDAGWSAPAIAELFDCSTSSVYRRLDAARRPRRQRAPMASRAQLLAGLEQGMSAPQLAAHLGISTASVSRALAREGLLTPRQASRRQQAERLRHLREQGAAGLG